MSYNEISNILDHSVVLPNKPLSNLEIIYATNKVSLYGGVFFRDTSLKGKIKRMWYFKFRFIFWRWYTLGDVVQER